MTLNFGYCSLAYSTLASFRMGISDSGLFFLNSMAAAMPDSRIY
jgi:hypothetical protein